MTFGVNALPVIQIPPIDANYQTPQGIFLFAQEMDGRKPRVYVWNLSLQRSLGNKLVAEAAYVGSQGRRLTKRFSSRRRCHTRRALPSYSRRAALLAAERHAVLVAVEHEPVPCLEPASRPPF